MAQSNLGSTPWFEERLAMAMEARQAQVPPCPNGFIYIVRAGDTLFQLSRQFGVSLDALVNANPQLADPSQLRVGEALCIPTGGVPSPIPPCPGGQLVTVQPGDTLFAIARRFGISLDQLLAANPQITDPSQIQVGQVICVPTAMPIPSCPGGQLVTVQPGDTLFAIARRFGISLDQLLAANPQITDPNQIQVGQVICVPAAMPIPSCPGGQLVTVQPGDTLFAIARRFGISLDQLLAANPQITDPNQIQVGQIVCVPAPASPVAPGGRSCLVLNPTDNAPQAEGVALFVPQTRVAMLTAAGIPQPGEFGRSSYIAWLRRAGTDSWTRIPLTQSQEGVFSGRTVLPVDPSALDAVLVTAEGIEAADRPTGLAVLEGSLSQAASPPST